MSGARRAALRGVAEAFRVLSAPFSYISDRPSKIAVAAAAVVEFAADPVGQVAVVAALAEIVVAAAVAAANASQIWLLDEAC